MVTNYIMQYNDFISAYEKLFHIKSNDSIAEIYDLVLSILFFKYKVNINDLVLSILMAIKFNYRFVQHYINLLNLIFNKYSIPVLKSEIILNTAELLHLHFYINDLKVCQVEYSQNNFPRSNEIQFIIMNDQIEKFTQYVVRNSIENICIDIPGFSDLSVLDACCYFGSVNIFHYIISNLRKDITQSCLKYSFIGGNTFIINECLKCYSIYNKCLEYIVASHNHKFLEYVLDKSLFSPREIDYETIINSKNLKAVFLMFERDKFSIIPWCAAFSQTIDIFRNENLDFSKKSSKSQNILHFAGAHNTINILESWPNYIQYSRMIVNAKDNDGKTALHYASIKSCKEATEILILQGADVNLKDNMGLTALHHAALNDNKYIAKILISHGAYINSKDNVGNTALHYAVMKNNESTIEVLAFHNADVNAKNNVGITPLYTAAEYDKKDIAKFLILHGADVNVRNDDGFTILHCAAWKNSKETAELLILNGADFNAKDYNNETPLELAANNNKIEVQNVLISYVTGAKTVPKVIENKKYTRNNNVYSSSQNTPQNNNNILTQNRTSYSQNTPQNNNKILTQNRTSYSQNTPQNNNYTRTKNEYPTNNYSPQFNSKVSEQKPASYTPNNYTNVKIEFSTHYHTPQYNKGFSQNFVSYSPSNYARDKSGYSTLLNAVRNNNLEMVRNLISRGVNINAKDKDGCTALHIAVQNNDEEIVKILISQGIDINSKTDDGKTPLHYASEFNRVEIARFLISHGAHINAKDKNGYTCLHFAAKNNCSDVVRLLISNCSYINVRDYYGLTPLQLADRFQCKETAAVIDPSRNKRNSSGEDCGVVCTFFTLFCMLYRFASYCF